MKPISFCLEYGFPNEDRSLRDTQYFRTHPAIKKEPAQDRHPLFQMLCGVATPTNLRLRQLTELPSYNTFMTWPWHKRRGRLSRSRISVDGSIPKD